ncbi:GAF domain-containing protein [Rhizomicrobium electricum]|uniref:GAF domain-containing protein n=1 Tax=Rhizomicrobium electricum TaxID=480070 RepID=A0ABP3Q5T9_9PROT|nr:GAF domain-containing protein [Rhizomicrobium electricum]NIJ49251.1 GAF domain-containing protein [Rhizomicrobium electricum]
MTQTKTALYRDLLLQAQGLVTGIDDPIANAANIAALIWYGLPDLNWAGFYFAKDRELVLGPFQGKPACVRIADGKGVCGAAAAARQTLIVPDVHAFEGHIACDSASNAEIVVPLIRNGAVIGVLDLDSPLRARFDEADAAGLEAIAAVWIAASKAF